MHAMPRRAAASATVMTIAGRNAATATALAFASAEVIGRRMALGMIGATDPLRADYAELARLLPEKLEAATGAGFALLQQPARLWQQAAAFSLAEAVAFSQATLTIATSRDAAALASAQQRVAAAWFGRMTAQGLSSGILALRWQQAMMAPFHSAAAANMKRLRRGRRPVSGRAPRP